MEPFHQHVFVCTQGKPEGVASCPSQGSLRVLQALERELDAQGLGHQVQVTTCGCLGLCENGPVMITYPEGIWYRGVKEEDVPEIVDSHLRSGKVVSRLVWSDSPAMKTKISDSREHYRAMVQAKDEAGTLPDTLNEMIRSFMPAGAVLMALELDVFTAVASGASAKQVAEKIHADPRATEMLLNVLVSLRLLDKKEGHFFNTAAATRFLCEGSRDNVWAGLMPTAR